MENTERLRVVLKRLIEEMGYYDEEYAGWTELAKDAGLDTAAGLIKDAQESIRSGNRALQAALDSIR
jgi:hypothetical protein